MIAELTPEEVHPWGPVVLFITVCAVGYFLGVLRIVRERRERLQEATRAVRESGAAWDAATSNLHAATDSLMAHLDAVENRQRGIFDWEIDGYTGAKTLR